MNDTFELFGLTIHWYGVILTMGMVIALMLFLFLSKKRKVSSDFALSMFLFAITFAVFGARLFYVLPRAEYWESWEGFTRAFNISEGGLTIMGAIPIGALGIAICCKIYKKSPMRILDIVAPCMLLGQIIGRWGNFINQELYGVVVTQDWLKFFPMAVNVGGVWHYASFFYEMMLNIVGISIALVLFFKLGDRMKPGVMTLGYLLWYSFVRGCLEFIKDGALEVGGVKLIQAICFAIIPVVLILIILTQMGKIKFETEKMYMRHFNLTYDPPEYVDTTFSQNSDNDTAQKLLDEQLNSKNDKENEDVG